MSAKTVLSQRIDIGHRPAFSVRPPTGAVRAEIRAIMSDDDARDPTHTMHGFVRFWDGIEWITRDSFEGWVGAEPHIPGNPPARPGFQNITWDVEHPPQLIGFTFDVGSAFLIGGEIEFFDAQGNSLEIS